MNIEGNAGWALRRQIASSLEKNSHVYTPIVVPDVLFIIQDVNGKMATIESGPAKDPVKKHLVFADQSLAIAYAETLSYKSFVSGYRKEGFAFSRYLYVFVDEFEAKYVSLPPL